MRKTAIVYASLHHSNTKKLVDAIAEKNDIDTIDAEKTEYYDLTEYEMIGFASGIDFGRFYPSVEKFLDKNLPENKCVFFIYTCAKDNTRFTEAIKSKANSKKAIILGEYGCKGYNTYGPLKLIGGMNKNHPSTDEINGAISFFASL